VRVHDLDSMSSHVSIEFVCARHVERVSQRQRQDLLRRQLHVPRQRRLRPHSEIQIVPACDQTVR
jgi:hypothetical protein